jgi:hypothetical protein
MQNASFWIHSALETAILYMERESIYILDRLQAAFINASVGCNFHDDHSNDTTSFLKHEKVTKAKNNQLHYCLYNPSVLGEAVVVTGGTSSKYSSFQSQVL